MPSQRKYNLFSKGLALYNMLSDGWTVKKTWESLVELTCTMECKIQAWQFPLVGVAEENIQRKFTKLL